MPASFMPIFALADCTRTPSEIRAMSHTIRRASLGVLHHPVALSPGVNARRQMPRYSKRRRFSAMEQAPAPGAVPKQKILVVEDDAKIARVLQLELGHEGFAVEWCGDGATAIERALKGPDLIILDLLLPRVDGLEVCRRVRKHSSVPIIILTAKDAVPDRITGLDTGANDYLTKPFSIEELLARIRVQLRSHEPAPRLLSAKDLVLNRDTHEVKRGSHGITLTAKEFSLLEFLLMYPNKVHT